MIAEPRDICVLAIGLLLLSAIGAGAQEKPRRIKVIGTGKAEGMPILTAWFSTEPSTDPIIIPTRVWGDTTHGDIKRFMRIYFPRTYDTLVEYEFFFLAQVDMVFFTLEHQRWMYDALTDHQKGGVNTRSIMSTHSYLHEPWRDSILSDAFPNDVVAVMADTRNQEGQPGRLVVSDGDSIPNVMKAFKPQIEGIFPSYGGLNTIPKPGSTVLSYTSNNENFGSPVPGQVAHVFYWRWNNSVTFTFQDMVYNDFWSAPESGSMRSNPYALDIVVNIIWFSTGRDLPQDPLKVHDLRRLFFSFNIEKSLLTSLLDFAEKFGANPSKEYLRLGQIEDIRREGAYHYLDREFDEAYDSLETARSDLKTLEEDASKLKDRALLWVYLVEWLVTTGVFLVAGVLLWTLMVRRALYREVRVTKWAR
jgi:hypothetical protein